MTKCLRAVMDQQGEFDGKDVTKYLKIYWREVKLHDLNERIAITKFSTLVELEVKSVVEKLIEGAYLWEEFFSSNEGRVSITRQRPCDASNVPRLDQ